MTFKGSHEKLWPQQKFHPGLSSVVTLCFVLECDQALIPIREVIAPVIMPCTLDMCRGVGTDSTRLRILWFIRHESTFVC